MKTIYYLFLLFTFVFSTLIDAKAKPVITTSDSVYCNGAPILFTANVLGTVNYSWNFGNQSGIKTSLTNNFSHTFSLAGTYIVTLVVQDASFNYDTTKKVIRIKPNVTANFNLDQYSTSGKFCISTEFSISQWIDIKGFDSLHWDFGDGTKSKIFSPHLTYNSTGNFNIKLDAYGFCGAHSTSKQVEIVNDANGKSENNI
jgi:PKD repeat protein